MSLITSLLFVYGAAVSIDASGFLFFIDTLINAICVYCSFSFPFNEKSYRYACDCNGNKYLLCMCCYCCYCCNVREDKSDKQRENTQSGSSSQMQRVKTDTYFYSPSPSIDGQSAGSTIVKMETFDGSGGRSYAVDSDDTVSNLDQAIHDYVNK